MASSDGDRDVFSGLPKSRPQRRSAKRDRGSASDGADKPRRAAKKAPPQARAAASTKPSAARGKTRTKTAKQKEAPPVPPAGYATPTDDDAPRGADLVGTAVQAAGELAQIGIAFGGRALKSAIQRLPRP
jgi:hypothetical protein